MQKSTSKNTKAALVAAAERLFAEKGISSVSVRDITRAAGARNESALHYHFGDVRSLITVVFERRFQSIEAERLAHLAKIDVTKDKTELTQLMCGAVRPLIEACDDESGRTYAKFLVQLMSDPRFDLTDLVGDIAPAGITTISKRAAACMTHIPPDIRKLRLQRMLAMSIILVADHARQYEAGIALSTSKAVHEAGVSLAAYLLAKP